MISFKENEACTCENKMERKWIQETCLNIYGNGRSRFYHQIFVLGWLKSLFLVKKIQEKKQKKKTTDVFVYVLFVV